MKIRFYCDLPPMINILERPRFWSVTAVTPIGPPPALWQRITFDVEFPAELLREIKESGDMGEVRNVAVIAETEK